MRMLPDEDTGAFLEQVKKIVNDPAVEVHFTARASRPAPAVAAARLRAFKAIEAAVTRSTTTRRRCRR